MYQALYRKWRPRTFDDVAGQSHITDTLKRQVTGGRLSHAYLFTGTRGTGKTTCAKIRSRAVNCEHPVDGNPCNTCAACTGTESAAIPPPTTVWIRCAPCGMRRSTPPPPYASVCTSWTRFTCCPPPPSTHF